MCVHLNTRASTFKTICPPQTQICFCINGCVFTDSRQRYYSPYSTFENRKKWKPWNSRHNVNTCVMSIGVCNIQCEFLSDTFTTTAVATDVLWVSRIPSFVTLLEIHGAALVWNAIQSFLQETRADSSRSADVMLSWHAFSRENKLKWCRKQWWWGDSNYEWQGTRLLPIYVPSS